MKIAIVYQAAPAPVMNGIKKPMKEGGYSDSGADIACCLLKNGVEVALPVDAPDEMNNFDWVFPDTEEGIQCALEKGADVIWLNTVLFKGHPIEKFRGRGIRVIGQEPEMLDFYDNKYKVNRFLAENGLPMADQLLVKPGEVYTGPIPCVLKPIRGRGSQGVVVAHTMEEYEKLLQESIDCGKYGDTMMAEPYLPGREITLSVLAGGECLPVVERFHHQNGIAPYSGKVAVSANSKAIPMEPALEEISSFCGRAAKLLQTKALIRVDGRQDEEGNYKLFDVNVKPNMTGSSRPHRMDQDSLTLLAARAAGMDYFGLLQKLLQSAWKL